MHQVIGHHHDLLLFSLVQGCSLVELVVRICESEVVTRTLTHLLEKHGGDLTTDLERGLRHVHDVGQPVNFSDLVRVEASAVLLQDPLVMLELHLHILVDLLDVIVVVKTAKFSVPGLHALLAGKNELESDTDDRLA